MKVTLLKFVRDKSGATAIEYSLIAGIVSIVIVTALATIGTNLNNKFSNIANGLN